MRKIWSVLLGTAMVTALMTGCGNQQATAPAEEMTQEEMAPVEEQENVVEAFGTVDAQTIKQIFLDFPAKINDIYVNVGQEIKAGDKLINIDYDDYMLSITQKETELSLDKISADSNNTSSAGENSQIAVLQKKVASLSEHLADGTDPEINAQENIITSANNELVEKQRNLKLAKQLLDEGAGSQEDVTRLEADIEDLNNKITNAKQQIEVLRKQKNIEISELKAQIAVLQDTISDNQKRSSTANSTYAVKEEVSNLEVAQMKNKYTKGYIKGNDIINDIPKGVVKSITAVEGNKVGNDGAALMELIDTASLVVKANVPEEFIKDVKIGDEVDIIPYADREAVVKGKVKDIQQMAVTENGEIVIPVIIEALEESPYICYGYSTDVEIHVQK